MVSTNCSVNCIQRIRKVPKKLQQMGQQYVPHPTATPLNPRHTHTHVSQKSIKEEREVEGGMVLIPFGSQKVDN